MKIFYSVRYSKKILLRIVFQVPFLALISLEVIACQAETVDLYSVFYF
jgi:hypothetical protein